MFEQSVGRGSWYGRMGFVGGFGRLLNHVVEVVIRPWVRGLQFGSRFGVLEILIKDVV